MEDKIGSQLKEWCYRGKEDSIWNMVGSSRNNSSVGSNVMGTSKTP